MGNIHLYETFAIYNIGINPNEIGVFLVEKGLSF